jgi:subtilisin family serine protease
MNRRFHQLLVLVLTLSLLMAACSKEPLQDITSQDTQSTAKAPLLKGLAGVNYIDSAYIVVLKDDGGDIDGEVSQMTKNYRIQSHFRYKSAIRGFSGRFSQRAIDMLRNDPHVAYIEQDQVAHFVTTQTSPPSWGLDRVDQRSLPLDASYSYNQTGTDVDAYIIDCGILLSHTDFGGRAVTGYDAITPGGLAIDGNGHGTHVAGTVGGTMYGMAKNVRLIAVRVLDNSGSGSYSQVIAGIDWVTNDHTTRPAVANMSLGGGASTALDDAVRRSIVDGVTYCIAAGNSAANASTSSPARVTQAITVGATDNTDTFAYFSNYGSIVDICAPGVNIMSDWNTSVTATNTISGTSMATPHVTGAVALYLEENPTASPADVQSAIKANGTPNKIKSLKTGTVNLLLYSIVGTPPPPQAPAAPALNAPANAATGVAVPAVLSWAASTGATSYSVQVSATSDFAAFVYTVSGISGTSTTATGLSYSSPYYWRVNATNDGGTSDWSTVWSFTTRTQPVPPAIPVLNSPADLATGVAIPATLVWNASAGAASYTVQVSLSSSFATLVFNTSGITGTSANITGLSYNTLYYWRVSATSTDGTSGWSTAWSFTTVEASLIPDAPVLSSPANGTTRVKTPVTLSWIASVNATSYTVQVSTSSTFSSFVYNQSGITSTSTIVSSLSRTRKYYWRVSASNSSGTSAWSATRNFTTR